MINHSMLPMSELPTLPSGLEFERVHTFSVNGERLFETWGIRGEPCSFVRLDLSDNGYLISRDGDMYQTKTELPAILALLKANGVSL